MKKAPVIAMLWLFAGTLPAFSDCMDQASEKALNDALFGGLAGLGGGTDAIPDNWKAVGPDGLRVATVLVIDEFSRKYERANPGAPYARCELAEWVPVKDMPLRLDVIISGNPGAGPATLDCKAISISPSGKKTILKRGRCLDSLPSGDKTQLHRSSFSFVYRHDPDDADGSWKVVLEVADSTSRTRVDVPVEYILGILPIE